MPSIASELAYTESPNFLSAEESGTWATHPFAHLCRVLARDFDFKGIYTLGGATGHVRTPVVAVLEASNEEEARRIHRLVWNQDFVPFILVQSPRTVRLYSGFQWSAETEAADLIAPLKDFSHIHEVLAGLHADEIDDGTVWALWGKHLRPDRRLDWHLLDNLKRLSAKLRALGLDASTAHALIGRFVYLRYLRDRGFLSDRKLGKWNLEAAQLFGRGAALEAFQVLNANLDEATDGLNGAIFPFEAERIEPRHLSAVARAFAGDDPQSGQMALDLGMYDFSYIPVETLSVIYEQFLHEPTADGKLSKGQQGGAYYTPIPLVNQMLAEMDARQPLGPRMRLLDPSCGSGAFLVQAYRILIERAIRDSGKAFLPPSDLRNILQRQVFGVDRDRDACRIAEMSLLVTLLDYVDPPDLEGKYHNFHLPKLSGSNIFESDFFATEGAWVEFIGGDPKKHRFDWVVGNPPWKDLKNPPEDPSDKAALAWILRKDAPPTGGNQLAEAFVWKAREIMRPGGHAAFVLPAMTLFKSESKGFRKALFSQVEVEQVINYANLCYVLFGGRAVVPAMTLLFREAENEGEIASGPIQSFAPLVINQEANRPQKSNKQMETWTISVNASEIQEIARADAASGSSLLWKVAMWGDRRDLRLLQRLENRFPLLGSLENQSKIRIAQGLELRDPALSNEKLDPVPEAENQRELLFAKLKNCGRIVHFPEKAMREVTPERCWVRKGRGKLPLLISKPPHIIVDATRRFAVFSDRFIVVPPRKIGIGVANTEDTPLLRALALLLNSDYAVYHQFFVTSEWGVQKSISTQQTLKALPIPDLEVVAEEWAEWHSRMEQRYAPGETLSAKDQREINEMVFNALGLRHEERLLIEDFVKINLLQIKGKVEREAIRSPDTEEMLDYLRVLRDQLDAFFEDDTAPTANHLTCLWDERSAMIEVVLQEGPPVDPAMRQAGGRGAKVLSGVSERITDRSRQWLYFERNLRVYRDGKLYLFKPRQRVHWTRRQAILDADELIAEALSARHEEESSKR